MSVRQLPLALVLVAAILAAVPAAAVAQNAGDDQYADPFGPVQEAPDDGSGEQPPPVQGQTEPYAPAESQDVPVSASETTAQTTGDPATLPRTGFEAWLLAAAGWWALLGGIALRRVLAT